MTEPHRQPYMSSLTRTPTAAPLALESTISELTGPGPALCEILPSDADLTRVPGASGEPIGERIIVTGTVLDAGGAPVQAALVEVWQANAAGRYIHVKDHHPAPLDPNFRGFGRCVTDENGRYRFQSIKPGAYPWKNHENAWRPPHIHFSIFGHSFASRLITQMYFPGDPLHQLDPILGAIPREHWPRLTATFDIDITVPEWALGYRFDIVLGGPNATPFETAGERPPR